jgi:hypothetical protein
LIDIDGFVKISRVNRSVNIGKRNEGGLAVFCRHFLNDGITVEKEYKKSFISPIRLFKSPQTNTSPLSLYSRTILSKVS